MNHRIFERILRCRALSAACLFECQILFSGKKIRRREKKKTKIYFFLSLCLILLFFSAGFVEVLGSSHDLIPLNTWERGFFQGVSV